MAYLALSIMVSFLQLLAPWPMKIIVDNVLGDVPLPHWIAASVPSIVAESKISFLVALVLATVVVKLLTSGAGSLELAYLHHNPADDHLAA